MTENPTVEIQPEPPPAQKIYLNRATRRKLHKLKRPERKAVTRAINLERAIKYMNAKYPSTEETT